MKCIKCGAELQEGSKYCSHCGEEITNTSVDDVKGNIIKRIWSRISLYNRFLIIFVFMLGILASGAYFFSNTLGIMVSMIQIVLLILAMLMKKQIIKSKKGLHILLIIIAALMMIPYVNSYRPDYGNAKEFEWDEIILHDAIPTPESLFGEIAYNSDEDFTVYIYKITANQFAEYVKKCKENGFTVDVEEWGYYFSAYNGLEYKLSLEFNEENGRMYINLELLEQYGVFEWVENDITKMLPIPKSNIGKIVENDNYLFKVYVARITIKEYEDYIKACQLKGFDVEVENTEKTFVAKNNNGYKVQVSYEENNVISITLSEPEYNVEIKIKCEENWIFNTYDVKLYLNDSYKRTISHGETETYNFSLKQGVYVIKFVSSEDEKTVGTVNVEIVQDEKYEFKISCGFEKIDIKTVKGKTFVLDEQEESKENIIVNEDEVLMPEAADYYVGKDQEKVSELLRDLGFQNVSIVEVKDIVFGVLVQDGEVGEVSIAGIKDFEKNKIFKKTDAVIITYHAYMDEAKADAEANKQIEENKQNTESLTIDNCAELKQLLNSSNATIEECEVFGRKYSGRIFEFDAVMKYSYSADDSGNIGIAFYAIVDGRVAYRYCFYINNANQYHNGLEQFKFDKYVGVSEEEPVHIRVRMDYFEEGFGRFHVKAIQIDKRK